MSTVHCIASQSNTRKILSRSSFSMSFHRIIWLIRRVMSELIYTVVANSGGQIFFVVRVIFWPVHIWILVVEVVVGFVFRLVCIFRVRSFGFVHLLKVFPKWRIYVSTVFRLVFGIIFGFVFWVDQFGLVFWLQHFGLIFRFVYFGLVFWLQHFRLIFWFVYFGFVFRFVWCVRLIFRLFVRFLVFKVSIWLFVWWIFLCGRISWVAISIHLQKKQESAVQNVDILVDSKDAEYLTNRDPTHRPFFLVEFKA